MSITLRTWGPEEPLEPLAEVVGLAFADYPVMRMATRESVEPSLELITEIAYLTCLERRLEGAPIPVMMSGDRPVGVALIKFPNAPELPEITARWQALADRAGSHFRSFFEEFLGFVHSAALPMPHAWLAMIAVHPDFQGQGVGKVLLAETDRLAAEAGAVGIGLDTETAENVARYERVGYRVIQQGEVRGITVSVMFKTIEAG